MRRTIIGSSALGIVLAAVGVAAYGSFGAMGCTILTSDTVDGGYIGDGGDGGSDAADTGGKPDTGSGFAVIINAKDLIDLPGTSLDGAKDLGYGSTTDDIKHLKVYNAIGAVGALESTPIGRDASNSFVNGRLTGLAAGAPVTITVTGYLRGLNGDNGDVPSQRIPFVSTTCTATPSATSDVDAKCTFMKFIPGTAGVIVSSDVLPTGWCDGPGKTGFFRLRARQPLTGPSTVSRTVDDCKGVVFIPLTKITETAGRSEFALSMEPPASGAPCTLTKACQVDRKCTGGTCATDVYVISAECGLSNATTGGTCF